MTALSIQPPYPILTDRDGSPLEAGYVWIGAANLAPQTNPIAVYWDAALTQAAAQPIRTAGGYPVNNGTPARLYVGSDYSILVQNRKATTVYSAPSATERLSGVVVSIDSTNVSFLQAGTGAVTRTAQAKMRDVVSVKDFGAVGDGVTNDTAAIQAAIAYCKTSGKALSAVAGETYYLGTFPNTTGAVKLLVDFDGFVFNTNNCKFTATYNSDPSLAASVKMTLIKVKDASNVVIGDFQASADYCERTGTQQGIVALLVSSEAANARNLSIGTITGSKLLSTVTCTSDVPGTYRYRAISVRKLVNDGGYYNLNCADNGDDLVADIYSNDLVRSYFVYGVSGHSVNVYSTNHLKFTDVLIKRYEYDTKSIKVNYTCPSDLSSYASISIEHQNASDTGVIQDIYVDFDVAKSNAANPTLNFVSFDAGGSVRTTTNSITDNIHIRGKTNSSTPTVIQSTISGTNGENISRLFIQRLLLLGVNNFKRFIVYDSMNRLVARGDVNTGMAIRFNVSECKFTPNWGLLTVWGADNPGSSSAEYILRQYFVLFTVPSTGSTSVGTTTTIATQTAGVLGPTITFPAQTNTFDFEVDVNNYTNANRQCSATLELFRVN